MRTKRQKPRCTPTVLRPPTILRPPTVLQPPTVYPSLEGTGRNSCSGYFTGGAHAGDEEVRLPRRPRPIEDELDGIASGSLVMQRHARGSTMPGVFSLSLLLKPRLLRNLKHVKVRNAEDAAYV